jgi:hypothetical protein
MVSAARCILSVATQEASGHPNRVVRQDPSWSAWNIYSVLFGVALGAVAMSIAVTELLLAGSLGFRVIAIAWGR